MARKTYLNQDVYQAAKARLEFIFDEFQHIYFSFSGGKDSGVMMELALEVACERDRLPLHALLIDLEGHYREHIEYSLRICDRPEIKPYWICLPLSLRNAVSQFEPKWVPWEEEKCDIWVRQMPDRPYVITEHNMPAEWTWFHKGQEFEEFILYFADWFADHRHADKTACVVGIRADESMNRYRTIVNDRKTRYADQGWTTLVKGLRNTVYNAYPIYDWRVEDIWTYVGKTGCDYNKIYDYMYKTGRSIHDMRICQPYGDDQRKGLDMFQECEPETWYKVVQRVSGANFGAIYRGGAILGNIKVELPPGHTWESYAKLLLSSMPPFLKEHYIEYFNTFFRWWDQFGGGRTEHQKVVTDQDQYDEMGIYYSDKIPYEGYQGDDAPDTAKWRQPLWKRICKVLLKNDYWCKELSFSQVKGEYDRLESLKEKYRDI